MLACGGYRSGSTLQYNLIGEYVERANVGRRIGLLDPPQAALLRRGGLWGIVDALGVAVAKSHHAVSEVVDYGGAEEVWPELRAAGLLTPVYSVRDWRDVVWSMSRQFGLPVRDLFESPQWRENLAHLDAWLSMGAHVQRYEVLRADPEGALRDLSRRLGLPLSAEAAAGAAEAAGVEAGLAAQRRVAEASAPAKQQEAHARLLLHKGHIADPDGGAWREGGWNAAEIGRVRAEVQPLMQRFGYAWD